MQLSDLIHKHDNEDIYVIGSGASLDYIGERLLEDKTIICVNHTIRHVRKAKSLYVVAKEPNESLQSFTHDQQAILVTCEQHSGHGRKNVVLHPKETAMFKPAQDSIKQGFGQCTALTISASTITTAMHLAALMGAKCILLIGHDCGTLDGKIHATGYDKSMAVTAEEHYQQWMHMNNVEHQTLFAKSVIESVFGCSVHSINPFINFGLERHTYKKF